MGARSIKLNLLFAIFLVLGGAAGGQGLREQGGLLLEAGRFDETRALALAALEKDPADFEASILLCQSLLGLGRPAEAAGYASKAWERRRDPRLAELLGEALFQQGKNEEALAWFQTYLAALPEGNRAGLAYYFTGEIYIRLGRYGHADIAFAAALRHSPGNARWWNRLGWAQEKAGEGARALDAYERALRLDPRLEDAAIGRERILSKLRG